jgi:hypothetical protein
MSKVNWKEVCEKQEIEYDKIISDLRKRLKLHEERNKLIKMYLSGEVCGEEIDSRMLELKKVLYKEVEDDE